MTLFKTHMGTRMHAVRDWSVTMYRGLMRGLLVICLLHLVGVAQTVIDGKTTADGKTVIGSTTPQDVSIYVVLPPTNADNASFVANVMTQNSIDGVTVPLIWANIETVPPDTSACTPSDTCQLDPIVPMYHHYGWSTYDSTTFPGIWTWFAAFSGAAKKVNLLLIGAAQSNPNGATPHYVTTPSWYSLFTTPYAPSSSYARQDVINALKDCTGVPWAGQIPSGSVSSGSTVTVNDSACCSTSSTQSNAIQTGDLVWVNVTSPSGCSTSSAGSTATAITSSQFQYTPQGSCSGSISSSNVTYISSIQSWPVPYELPYKAALKALWAATLAHFNSNYQANSTNVGGQLGYIRPGESTGAEAFPYCTSGGPSGGLKGLAAPYTYVKSGGSPGTSVGWIDYYKEMLQWAESQTPHMKFFAPLNQAESNDLDYGTQEAAAAATSSNGHGFIDGFGSQGLSLLDYNNCANASSNWCESFDLWYPGTMPLELQQLSLSDEQDENCTTQSPPPANRCAVPPGDSGDLRVWLPYAVTNHLTVLELYYLDAGLAFDPNYCTSFTGTPPHCGAGGYIVGTNTFLTVTLQATFMNDIGQGSNCSPPVSGAGGASTGNCAYATTINNAHGSHQVQ
jgi:hypothetical protein